MSAFETTVVRDSRIQDISSKGSVQIHKGPSESNYQSVTANSVSTSNVTFSVVVPSESVVVDRHMTMTATQTLRVVIPARAGRTTEKVFSYGSTHALQAFPLNALFQNATTTINQTSISTQVQDIMAPLMRMSDDEVHAHYDAPHQTDKLFKTFEDMVLTSSNPLGNYEGTVGDNLPRGAHPLDSFTITRAGTTPAAVTEASAIGDITAALTSIDATSSWVIDLTYTTTEPLLFMSPFLSGEGVENQAGMMGVRNIDLVLNIDSSAKRAFSSGLSAEPMTVSLIGLSNCKLNLNYLSTQPSDMIASKSVLPFTEYQRYLTVHNADVASGASQAINTQALQLNQIPTKIYVVARKRLATQGPTDSNTFWPISQVSVNFNNKSGILAGASPHDLYKMSVRNGSKQHWYEFGGRAVGSSEGVAKYGAGSILVIDPSKDLCLPDYLTNGSIGSYSFSMNLTVKNTHAVALPPEIMIVCQYDGIFVTEAGISSKQTGLLTKDLVVSSSEAQFGEPSAYYSKPGWSNLGNRGIASSKNVPLLNTSKSGGARSGGAMSGGSGRGLSHCTY